MPRVREFSEDKVLDAAMYVFWSKGYAGTSLQNLVDATGLQRPSIYNAYGNKRSLFNIVLERYADRVIDRCVKTIRAAPTARLAVERLLDEIVQQHFDPATPGGCLIGLAAQEHRQHDADTRDVVAREFRKMDEAICARLTQGKSDGEFPDDMDPHGISTAIVSICTGLLTLAKANYSEFVLQRATRAVARLLG